MEKFVSDGSDADNVPGTKRLTGTCYLMIETTYDYKIKFFMKIGEESWTKIKACQLDAKSSRALKENLSVEKGELIFFLQKT